MKVTGRAGTFSYKLIIKKQHIFVNSNRRNYPFFTFFYQIRFDKREQTVKLKTKQKGKSGCRKDPRGLSSKATKKDETKTKKNNEIQIGDKVSANVETFCGECFFCKHGFINNCEKGGWHLGCKIDGAQAEYVRVPFADNGLNKISDEITDKNALFVGDVLASGYFGAELCEISKEDTVAIMKKLRKIVE